MSSTQNQPEVIVELSDPVNPVEIPDAPPTCSVNGLAKIGKKKRTSSAWVMYDFVDIPDPENQGAMKSVAKCKICGELKDPKSTSGTSHFFRHTKACSKKNRVDLTQTTISQAASGSGSSVGSCSSRSSFWQSLGRAPREPGAALLGELTRYQSEPDLSVEEFENFQVLKWWKENEKRFPVMSMIARDVLAVPVSTVASESAFSLGKRVFGDHRSSLTPEMLECTVFLNLWKVQFKQLLLPIDPLNDCITPEEEVGDWQGSQPPPTA